MVTSTTTSPGHSRPVIKGGVTDISRNHFGMEYTSNYNWDPCFSAIKNLERIFSYSSNQLPYGSGNEEPVDSNFWDQWYNKKEQTQQLSLGTPLFSEEAIHFFCDTSDSDSEERVDSIYEDEKSNEKEFEQSIQKYSSYTKDQIFIILNEKNITWASRIIPSLVFSNHVDVLHHLIDSTHENNSHPKCNDCRKFSAQDTLPQLVQHIEKHHFVSNDCFAGPAEVQDSVGTVKKENQTFIQYLVNPGETIYGISTRYGVSISKLMELNPDLENGLKLGTTILNT